MVFPPTAVLVLGAGSNHDYGFPTGVELIARIRGALMNRTLAPSMMAAGVSQDHIDRFERALRHLDGETLDQFLLGKAPHISLVGKMAAALVLHRLEQNLFNSQPAPGQRFWYSELASAIARALPEHLARLRILTFNYDRSLEYVLDSYIAAYCDSVMGAPSIVVPRPVHLHGVLGPTDGSWIDQASSNPDMTPEALKLAADGIKMYHEVPGEDERYVPVRDLLKQARSIVFLGFGFHPDNLGRLGLLKSESARLEHANIYATRFDPRRNLPSREKGPLWSDRVDAIISTPVQWFEPSVDCNDGFRIALQHLGLSA